MKKKEDKMVSYLKSKNNWQDSDMLLIERIPFIMRVLKRAEDEIENGEIFTIGARKELKKSPAFEIYSTYLNKLREILTILGMTPRERRKMESELQEMIGDDGFDD
jgi:P27 family predicted phage terminase small subunit